MKKVFISYRRSDSATEVGRLYDNLKPIFGSENIFKDLDSIPAGVDFRKVISDAVNGCEVLLAVIGPEWLTTKNTDGFRRIDGEDDFVRIEIAEALKKGVPVIPVLLGTTAMPLEEELPHSLKDLAFRNAIPLRADPDFHNDIKKLSKELVRHIPELENAKIKGNSYSKTVKWIAIALGSIMALALLINNLPLGVESENQLSQQEIADKIELESNQRANERESFKSMSMSEVAQSASTIGNDRRRIAFDAFGLSGSDFLEEGSSPSWQTLEEFTEYSVVTIASLSGGDDSVAGTLYRIEFEKIDNTRWQIVWVGQQWKCYRGGTDWGKTWCP